jgi:voltage-gated potassium channel
MPGGKVAHALQAADPLLRFMVVLSTILYLWELNLGLETEGFWFLWAERLLACLFTIEYFFRWYDDATDGWGWHYPHSPLGLIDLISILPFWLGFFLPVDWLHLVRTLRIFRLLKFFRYSRSLQLVALGFYRAWHHLKALGFAMLVIGLFCMVFMHEAERKAQPDKFDGLFSSAYFTAVTVCTVGYGDMSPVTIPGRIIAMCIFLFALTIFAGMLGVLGNSFVEVLKEEADPNVDPIALFQAAREEKLKMEKLDKDYGPQYKNT